MKCKYCGKDYDAKSVFHEQNFVYLLAKGFEDYDDIVPSWFPERIEKKEINNLRNKYCKPEHYVKDLFLQKEISMIKEELKNKYFSGVAGYVYFMKAENNNWVKIGVSKKPATRKNRIQTKLPFKIEIINQISSSSPYELEKLLHDIYDERRMNGEWFELTERQIREIKMLDQRRILEKIA